MIISGMDHDSRWPMGVSTEGFSGIKGDPIVFEYNSIKDDGSLYQLRTTTEIPRMKPTQRKNSQELEID